MNASKERYGAGDLKELFAGAKRLVVARGKKVQVLDPRASSPKEIAAVALGPTGNLRAPAVRRGDTWLIGFLEEAYDEQLG